MPNRLVPGGKGDLMVSTVLDVIIGVTFIFFVFASITSGMRELVAAALNARSKDLWREIRYLVDGDPIDVAIKNVRAVIEGANPSAESVATANQIVAALVIARDATVGAIGSPRNKFVSWFTDSISRADVKAQFSVPLGIAEVENISAEAKEAINDVKKIALRSRPQPNALRYYWRMLRRSNRVDDRPIVDGISRTAGEVADSLSSTTANLTDAIFNHPFVRSIDNKTPAGVKAKLHRLNEKDFASTIIEILAAAGADNDAAVDDALAPAKTAALAAATTAQTEGVESAFSAAKKALTDQLRDGLVFASGPIDKLTADLTALGLSIADTPLAVELGAARISAEAIPVSDQLIDLGKKVSELDDRVPIKSALQQALRSAEGSIANVRTSLENWFDRRMQALSDAYKRHTRFVAFGMGLIVALTFNVDPVDFTVELWENDKTRAVVVDLADGGDFENGIEKCVAEEYESSTATTTPGTTIAATEDGETTTTTTIPDNDETREIRRNCAVDTADALIDSGLPIGWDLTPTCANESEKKCSGFWDRISAAWGNPDADLGDWAVRWVGWLLAALAFAMGAPFWYNLLQRAQTAKAKISSKE